MNKRTRRSDSVSNDEIVVDELVVEYNGSVDNHKSILDFEKTEPISFYNEFVAAREPVVINGHINDEEWKGRLWSNTYLIYKCGSNEVRVEWRENNSERFGKGREKIIPFHKFVKSIERGDESLYLTTQELDYNSEGQPAIISPPLVSLREEFPLVPKLLQNLVVSNINMWFGSSTQHTTSGLHHDFHDNLYILLRGEKKFTLYSPAEALNMYTVGEITKVHPNGRINYKGQPTRADGADLQADVALRAAMLMEKAAAKLEKAESGGGAAVQEEAEDEIDEALEALLDAEMADDDEEGDYSDEDDEDEDEEEEDEEEEEGTEGKGNIVSGDDDDEEEKEDKLAAFLGLNKRKASEAASATTAPTNSSNSPPSSRTATATSSSPSNFSQVDTTLSDEELARRFPRFVGAKSRASTITLKAGQMLFLPAGWFHEVESVGSGEDGHLAFNYWFHPPDSSDYNKPYTSDFWATDFANRMASGNI